MLLFCLCGAVGQLFIFATIKRFGSLLNTLVTTTRKFFNILLSGARARPCVSLYLFLFVSLVSLVWPCVCPCAHTCQCQWALLRICLGGRSMHCG
jgi:hypothetical protein